MHKRIACMGINSHQLKLELFFNSKVFKRLNHKPNRTQTLYSRIDRLVRLDIVICKIQKAVTAARFRLLYRQIWEFHLTVYYVCKNNIINRPAKRLISNRIYRRLCAGTVLQRIQNLQDHTSYSPHIQYNHPRAKFACLLRCRSPL